MSRILYATPELPAAPQQPVFPWQAARPERRALAVILPDVTPQAVASDIGDWLPDVPDLPDLPEWWPGSDKKDTPEETPPDLYSTLSQYGLWDAFNAYTSGQSSGDFAQAVGEAVASVLCGLAGYVAPYSTGFANFLYGLCADVQSVSCKPGFHYDDWYSYCISDKFNTGCALDGEGRHWLGHIGVDGQCVACPEGEVYDGVTQMCVPNPDLQPPTNEDCILNFGPDYELVWDPSLPGYGCAMKCRADEVRDPASLYCVCGQGTVRQNPKDFNSPCVPYVAPSIKCPEGQVKNAAGECVNKVPVEVKKCPAGQVKDAAGNCNCPKGQHKDATGACIPDEEKAGGVEKKESGFPWGVLLGLGLVAGAGYILFSSGKISGEEEGLPADGLPADGAPPVPEDAPELEPVPPTVRTPNPARRRAITLSQAEAQRRNRLSRELGVSRAQTDSMIKQAVRRNPADIGLSPCVVFIAMILTGAPEQVAQQVMQSIWMTDTPDEEKRAIQEGADVLVRAANVSRKKALSAISKAMSYSHEHG